MILVYQHFWFPDMICVSHMEIWRLTRGLVKSPVIGVFLRVFKLHGALGGLKVHTHTNICFGFLEYIDKSKGI